MATASQLLPVPAGPMPKVMTFVADGVDVALLPAVLGRTVRPLALRSTSWVSTSLGRSSERTMSMERMTFGGSSG